MESNKRIIGIDVSKRTLDVHFFDTKLNLKISNNLEGFNQFKKSLKRQKFKDEDVLVVLEFTGGYEYRFLQFLSLFEIAFVWVPGLAIKRSSGIIRGKTDRVDAMRIARYGFEKQDSLKISKPLDKNVLELKELLSTRTKYVENRTAAANCLKERAHNKLPSLANDVIEKAARG